MSRRESAVSAIINRIVPLNTEPSRRRLVWAFLLASVVSLLAYAYYQQYVEYLDPCPLCITQRLFYLVIGVGAALGLFAQRTRWWQRSLAVLASLAALGGIVTASRQVWLQHLPPDQVPECGPGLQYWLDNESALSVLALLFKGDGNCAEVVWTFLGFSMGEWSLAWFVLLGALALLLAVRVPAAAAATADGVR